MNKKIILFVLFLLPFNAYAALTDNLSVFYNLDETSGSRADSLGIYNLTDNNTVLYATGIIGNAADFEKDNSEYLSASSAILPTGANADFSAVAWIKLETCSSEGIILSQKSGSESGRFLFSVNSSCQLKVFLGGVSTTITGSTTLNTGEWYFVAVVRDTNNINIYLNGNSTPEGSASDGTALSTANFAVGANVVPELYFDGLIDELGIWNRVLSTNELSELYNSGSGCTYPFNCTATASSTISTSTIGYQDWIFVNTVEVFLLSFIGIGTLFSVFRQKR